MCHLAKAVAACALICPIVNHQASAQNPGARSKAPAPTATVRPAQVDILSFQVSKYPRDEFGNGIRSDAQDTIAFWLANSGTAVNIALKLDRPFAGFDERASRLLQFKDDKGTDLTLPPDGKKINTFFSANKPILVEPGTDPTTAQIILRAYGTPAPGTDKLKIDADLVFLSGSGEQTAEQKNLELRPGTKIEIGPLRFQFEDPKQNQPDIGQPFPDLGGTDAMLVRLTYDRPLKLIKSVEWLDPDGKVIRSNGDSFRGDQRTSLTFGLPEEKRLGLRVVYYDKTEKITVPLRLEIGLGF
jgi:hypothetical protein